jgi:hypothetical protein
MSGSLTALGTGDKAAWASSLAASGGGHPFYDADVLEFLATSEHAKAELLVFEHGVHRVVMPWLLRDLPEDVATAGDRYQRDAFGPDYAGPKATGGTPREVLQEFWAALDAHARTTGTLSLFLRLNPFDDEQAVLDEGHGARIDRDVIWVNLTRGFDGAWTNFSSAARKNYKRSVAVGLNITLAEGTEHLDEFARIYASTMERREAQPRYRFDRDWFAGLLEAARGRTLMVTAWKGADPVASHLYLRGGGYAFSYLGGADAAHLSDRPTNAVVTAAIRALSESGSRRLILGGGYRPGDGIENFKRSFSPLAAPFRTLRRVFDRDAYMAASGPDASATLDGFFPAYRALRKPASRDDP